MKQQGIIKNAVASTMVRVAGMAATMLFSIFLGRTLGADGMGVINLSNRIVSLLLVVVLCGIPTTLIKNISIAFAKKDWLVVNNSMFTAKIITAVFSLFFLVLGMLISDWFCVEVFNEPRLRIPLIVALVSLLPQALSRVYGSGLNGFHKVWQSNLVDNTLASFFVLLALLFMHLAGVEISILNVAVVYAISKVFVALLVSIYWRRIIRARVVERPQLQARQMLRMSLPFFVSSAVSVIALNSDAVMIGWLSDSTQVGLYAAAINLALLISFFLNIANAVLNPHIASFYESSKVKELERMVQQVTWVLSVLGGASLLLFVLLGQFILSLWGEEFKAAYAMLVILACGQFVNVATGCVGALLIMCGHEKVEARILLISLGANLVLNYFLIQQWAALGAAITTSVSLSVGMIFRVVYVKKKMGISMWSLPKH